MISVDHSGGDDHGAVDDDDCGGDGAAQGVDDGDDDVAKGDADDDDDDINTSANKPGVVFNKVVSGELSLDFCRKLLQRK